MSSMESAPAIIPATSEATFTPALAPLSVATLRCLSIKAWRSALLTRVRIGTRPAADTRFGSSKVTDVAAGVCETFTSEMLLDLVEMVAVVSSIYPDHMGILFVGAPL